MFQKHLNAYLQEPLNQSEINLDVDAVRTSNQYQTAFSSFALKSNNKFCANKNNRFTQ